jgi:hypothetical protein
MNYSRSNVFSVLLIIASFLILNYDNFANASASTGDTITFGYSNSTQTILNSSPISSPILSSNDRQAMINATMNVPGIQAWSNHWHYVTTDFIGTYNTTVSWQYAIVRLQLLPSDNAVSHCDFGWEASAKVDLGSKKVLSAVYPTRNGSYACNFASGHINHHDETDFISSIIPPVYAAPSPPFYQGYSIEEQTDASSGTWWGNRVNMVPPYYNQNIFTDMNPSSLVEQLLNADWNQANGFAQGGWVIINYDTTTGIPPNTEDLVYVDESTYFNDGIHNTNLSVQSGYTETVENLCDTTTSKQQIIILYSYNNQIFNHDTNVHCTTHQSTSVDNNSVFFENYSQGPSPNWAKDLSSVYAAGAKEYDSSLGQHAWISSNNIDAHAQDTNPGISDTGSLVLTGSLSGSGTAVWSNLSLMPPYAGPCYLPAGGTLSVSCTLTSNTSVSGDLTIANGAVLIIPSNVILSMPFKTNKLTINSGGTVLVEPGGTITTQ